MLDFLMNDELTPLEKWLRLKEIEWLVKEHIKAIQSEVEDLVDSGEGYGQVSKVTKVTIKPKDSIVKFLEDKDLLRLVKKDDIDMNKVNQLVEAGVITEDELELHLEKKESSYLKKSKK